MGRSESKQAFEQGSAQSATDQANAQQTLGATNAALTNYNTNLGNFMNDAKATYGPNGEYARTMNTLGTSAAAAGSRNMGKQLAMRSLQTGENTAGYAPAVAEAQRQASRDLTDTLAQQNVSRMDKLTGLEQYGVDASKFPATIQASLYGPSVSGSASQMGDATNAAKTPGLWDTLLPALVQGGATVGAAFCPCAGSMIRMADDSKRAVEDTRAGDYVYPLGWTAPPNPLTATPQPRMEQCFEIVTRKGARHRGSKTHAVMLASCGYALMPELLHQVVLAELGMDEVVEVNDIGEQMVYPMAVGGSHCYCADGIWVLA